MPMASPISLMSRPTRLLNVAYNSTQLAGIRMFIMERRDAYIGTTTQLDSEIEQSLASGYPLDIVIDPVPILDYRTTLGKTCTHVRKPPHKPKAGILKALCRYSRRLEPQSETDFQVPFS